LGKGVVRDFVRYWLATRKQDPFLPNSLEASIQRGGGAATAADLLPLFESAAIKEQHALTYGTLLVKSNEPGLALAAFLGYDAPDDVQELVRFCFIYRCLWILAASDGFLDKSLCQTAWADFSGKIPHLAKGLRTDFERALVLEYLGMVWDLAKSMEEDYAPEVGSHVSAIREEIGGNENVLLALQAVDRLSEMRNRELAILMRKHSTGSEPLRSTVT
jgi:hypothetical protein